MLGLWPNNQSSDLFHFHPSPVPSTAKSCDMISLGAGLSVVRRPLLGLSPPQVLALSLSLKKQGGKNRERASEGHFPHTLRFNTPQPLAHSFLPGSFDLSHCNWLRPFRPQTSGLHIRQLHKIVKHQTTMTNPPIRKSQERQPFVYAFNSCLAANL